MIRPPPRLPLFPYTTLFRSKTFRLLFDADSRLAAAAGGVVRYLADAAGFEEDAAARLQSAVIAACAEAFEHLSAAHPQLEVDRKSTRLNSSHTVISYAVFCL